MDPLSSLVALTRPEAIVSKPVSGAGRWAIRVDRGANAGFGLVLQGTCHLQVEGLQSAILERGDFVLMPSYPSYVLSSHADFDSRTAHAVTLPCATETHYGTEAGLPDFKMLGGYFRFSSSNLSLIEQIMPRLVHIRSAGLGAGRIANVLQLLAEEARLQGPGHDLILIRLVDIMLIEALRYDGSPAPHPGLLAGLGDHRIGRALVQFHAAISAPWTVAKLAIQAGMSRTAFSENFTRLVGKPPMSYVQSWRMAVARDMLLQQRVSQEVIADVVGYQSASAFNTAFRRQMGRAPGSFARDIEAGYS